MNLTWTDRIYLHTGWKSPEPAGLSRERQNLCRPANGLGTWHHCHCRLSFAYCSYHDRLRLLMGPMQCLNLISLVYFLFANLHLKEMLLPLSDVWPSTTRSSSVGVILRLESSWNVDNNVSSQKGGKNLSQSNWMESAMRSIAFLGFAFFEKSSSRKWSLADWRTPLLKSGFSSSSEQNSEAN